MRAVIFMFTMKKKREEPTLNNILKLFFVRINSFSGSSRRSYHKAHSSFQVFLIGNYSLKSRLTPAVIESWIAHLLIQGLSPKTVEFYLEKVSSLYSGIADKITGGREIDFKKLKQNLKPYLDVAVSSIHKSDAVDALVKSRKDALLNLMKDDDLNKKILKDPDLHSSFAWVTLKSGVRPDVAKHIIRDVPEEFNVLNFCDSTPVTPDEISEAKRTIKTFLQGEPLSWFAMRLRPKVSFENILHRFSQLYPEVKMPEIFYPCHEIAKRIGSKIVWKGKPVIRDIVFFRQRRSEVYPLFVHIYDLAWCYSNPGSGASKYASIPDKAMEDFKKSIGFLTPDFQLAPQGEMPLNPGDKVIVLNGENVEEYGYILKKASVDEDGNKIFRVSLMHGHSHWDIGIDARLLRKA